MKCSKKILFDLALMNTQSTKKYACTQHKKHHMIDTFLKDLKIARCYSELHALCLGPPVDGNATEVNRIKIILQAIHTNFF
jgi:hypothetical protein